MEGKNSFIEPYGDWSKNKVPQSIVKVIGEVMKGMALGLSPQLAFDGTAGTYMMRDPNRHTVGIFKPIDEEAYAPNNPRGYVGDFGQTSFRSGVLSGEGVIREVASYLLDHNHFSQVPPTVFTEVMHQSFNYSVSQETDSSDLGNMSQQYTSVISSLIEPNLSEQHSISTSNTTQNKSDLSNTKIGMKYGSLQYFVKSDGTTSDYSSDLFSIEEVHKIIIIDLRILNLDRNDGNILVVKKKEPVKKSKKKNKSKSSEMSYTYRLIPIDHSLSIPDSLEIYSYDICWMDWDQAHVKFSKESLEYIKKLDILKDIKTLDHTFKFRNI